MERNETNAIGWNGLAIPMLLATLIATTGCGATYTVAVEIEPFTVPLTSTEDRVCYLAIERDGWDGQIERVRLEIDGAYTPGNGDSQRLEAALHARVDDPAHDPTATFPASGVTCVARGTEDVEVSGPHELDAGQTAHIQDDSDELLPVLEAPIFWLGARVRSTATSGEGRVDFENGRVLVTLGL